VRYVLDFAARHGLHPDIAIYEPGFMRAAAALARAAGSKTPIYRLMFCNVIAVGFPPRPYALSAYLSLLEEEAPGAPWMIAGVSADIHPRSARRSGAAAIFASGLRMRRWERRRATSDWLKRPYEWCAIRAQNPPRLQRCGRRWPRPADNPSLNGDPKQNAAR
jgi:hypothetical protein